jgi:hypothetical protein
VSVMCEPEPYGNLLRPGAGGSRRPVGYETLRAVLDVSAGLPTFVNPAVCRGQREHLVDPLAPCRIVRLGPGKRQQRLPVDKRVTPAGDDLERGQIVNFKHDNSRRHCGEVNVDDHGRCPIESRFLFGRTRT